MKLINLKPKYENNKNRNFHLAKCEIMHKEREKIKALSKTVSLTCLAIRFEVVHYGHKLEKATSNLQKLNFRVLGLAHVKLLPPQSFPLSA